MSSTCRQNKAPFTTRNGALTEERLNGEPAQHVSNCPSFHARCKAGRHSRVRIVAKLEDGFQHFTLPASGRLEQTFDLPVRLLSSHPKTGQDTLTVTRGPIVYTAAGVDNSELDAESPHFAGVGLSERETFAESKEVIRDIEVVMLTADGPAYKRRDLDRTALYELVDGRREWERLAQPLRFVPWFARGDRGGSGRVRTLFPRCAGQ